MNFLEVLKYFKLHANLISDSGGELYIVGEAVTEFLKGNTSVHPKFCITGLTCEKFMELSPDAVRSSKQYPEYVINEYKFGLARTGKRQDMGNKGQEVPANPLITIESDLKRRDITINSIAINVRTGDVVDPCNGIRHLNAKVLVNCPKTVIRDYPVQALRVANYASQMSDFQVSESLIKIISLHRSKLQEITPEQKFCALSKALSSNKPSRFFKVLLKANLLDVLYPEVYALQGVPHNPEYQDGDVFQHTMRVVDHMASMTHNPLIVWAGLAHDLGKATTPHEILPKQYDHDKRGRDIVKSMTWLPETWIEVGDLAAGLHMLGHRFSGIRIGNKVKLVESVSKSPLGLDGFAILLQADKPLISSAFNVMEIVKVASYVSEITEACVPESIHPGKDFDERLFLMKCDLVTKKLRAPKKKEKTSKIMDMDTQNSKILLGILEN